MCFGENSPEILCNCFLCYVDHVGDEVCRLDPILYRLYATTVNMCQWSTGSLSVKNFCEHICKLATIQLEALKNYGPFYNDMVDGSCGWVPECASFRSSQEYMEILEENWKKNTQKQTWLECRVGIADRTRLTIWITRAIQACLCYIHVACASRRLCCPYDCIIVICKNVCCVMWNMLSIVVKCTPPMNLTDLFKALYIPVYSNWWCINEKKSEKRPCHGHEQSTISVLTFAGIHSHRYHEPTKKLLTSFWKCTNMRCVQRHKNVH